jgi:hypothetical protein
MGLLASWLLSRNCHSQRRPDIVRPEFQEMRQKERQIRTEKKESPGRITAPDMNWRLVTYRVAERGRNKTTM